MELIPLKYIDDNPFQTRMTYDQAAIEELAADIAANGLLQPPVGRLVGPDGEVLEPDPLHVSAMLGGLVGTIGGVVRGRVQLAFGHRRFRAFKWLSEQPEASLDHTFMPIELRVLNDEQMALHAWSENSKRKDLNPVEEATAIARMSKDFKWSQEQVAEKLGLARPTVSNKIRLLRLPAEVLQRVGKGEVSERQAMALLPLYDLPETCRNAYERESGYYTKPKQLIDRMHGYSSDMLRNEVEQIVRLATCEINGRWSGHTFTDQHVKAATCDGCSLKIKQGPVERCTSKTCFERKQGLWQAERLAAASAATGIPIAPEEMAYGEYSSMVNVPHPGKVLEKGCENLRLRYQGTVGMAFLQADGFVDVEVICLHGKDGRCTCGSAAKAAATRADPDIQAQKAAEKRIKTEIIEPSIEAVLAGLQAGHLGVWRMLATEPLYGAHTQGETASLEELQRAIATALAARNDYATQSKYDFGQWKEAREKRLVQLGLDIPWATTALEQLQRKHERITGWLERRAWWKWDYQLDLEALQGNVANLQALAGEVADLVDDGAAALADEVADSLQTLLSLVDAAPAVNAEQRDFASGREKPKVVLERLLDEAPGSMVFDEALGQATAAQLRFGLVLAGGMERILALTGRLGELESVGTLTKS